MFGKQAPRLLRETWGGVLHPGPEGELREKGATQLAEELYAMFQDDIPLEHNAPITLTKTKPTVPALTINNNLGGTSMQIGGLTIGPTPGGTGTTIGGGDITIDGNTFNFDGRVTYVIDNDGNKVPLSDLLGGGVGGGLIGQVVSGSGDTYQADVYGLGIPLGVTGTIDVVVPGIASGDALDVGTWLVIIKAGAYYYSMPGVWQS